jgi:hypothetical protein
MCQNKELLTLISAACITETVCAAGVQSVPLPLSNINQDPASLIVQPREARIHDPHFAVLLCNRLREHKRVKMKRTAGLSIDADEHRIPIKIYSSLVWSHGYEINRYGQ